MWLDPASIKKYCKKKGLTLAQALEAASVSKTAYYSLTRKASVLPESIYSLAESLGVEPYKLLKWGPVEEARIRRREARLRKVLTKHPEVDRDNAWHTLIMLERTPLERLEGALRRGRVNTNI